MMAAPLKILSLFPGFNQQDWPGETPVEITVESDSSRHSNLIADMDILISQIFTPEMARNANSLRLIQASGAGTETVDRAVIPSGCTLANVYEHEAAIAEWVIMAMIALNRQVLIADQQLRKSDWSLSYFRSDFPPELATQTLGILGFGHIGKKTAELAKMLGMRVVVATRTLPDDKVAAKFDLEYIVSTANLYRVLSDSDFVLVTIPLLPETEGLIDEQALAQMRPDSYLINVSRAQVIAEKPLFEALRNGSLKGAALDVWYREPWSKDESPHPSDFAFWDLPNVLMSPHLSGLTANMWRRRLEFVAANVDRLARNQKLKNVLCAGPT